MKTLGFLLIAIGLSGAGTLWSAPGVHPPTPAVPAPPAVPALPPPPALPPGVLSRAAPAKPGLPALPERPAPVAVPAVVGNPPPSPVRREACF